MEILLIKKFGISPPKEKEFQLYGYSILLAFRSKIMFFLTIIIYLNYFFLRSKKINIEWGRIHFFNIEIIQIAETYRSLITPIKGKVCEPFLIVLILNLDGLENETFLLIFQNWEDISKAFIFNHASKQCL